MSGDSTQDRLQAACKAYGKASALSALEPRNRILARAAWVAREALCKAAADAGVTDVGAFVWAIDQSFAKAKADADRAAQS